MDILILIGYDVTSGDIITSRVRQCLHITAPLLYQRMIWLVPPQIESCWWCLAVKGSNHWLCSGESWISVYRSWLEVWDNVDYACSYM